jgi:hypothetical protein
MTTLSELTTMRVGGAAHTMVAPETPDALIAQTLEVWGSSEDWLVLGGGSNLVVADDGFDGTVIRVITRGIETVADAPDRVRLRVQAGEPWDDLVAYTVAQGLSGIEALSGIPGSTGAAPVQNIGAYGQEIVSTSGSPPPTSCSTTAPRRSSRASRASSSPSSWSSPATRPAPRSPTPSSRRRSGSSSASGSACRRCATQFSPCVHPRAWCSTRPIPTR